ncbi:MAG: HAD hydrolase-like protein, partial [Pseudomonadota bacterium]|nr:HAD hydrolase-like protein [Pseudomonadota bacterium]
MSGRLKMAVFDLDGTLVDSLAHIARAMATAFTAADLAPPPVAAVRAIIGLPLATAVTHLAPPLPSARIETIVAAYKDSYHARWSPRPASNRFTRAHGRPWTRWPPP